jgi:hypothetical protein
MAWGDAEFSSWGRVGGGGSGWSLGEDTDGVMDGLKGCGGSFVVGSEPGQWWEGADQGMEFSSEFGGERHGGGWLGEEEDAGDLAEI